MGNRFPGKETGYRGMRNPLESGQRRVTCTGRAAALGPATCPPSAMPPSHQLTDHHSIRHGGVGAVSLLNILVAQPSGGLWSEWSANT